jgi:hypothetical protein
VQGDATVLPLIWGTSAASPCAAARMGPFGVRKGRGHDAGSAAASLRVVYAKLEVFLRCLRCICVAALN